MQRERERERLERYKNPHIGRERYKTDRELILQSRKMKEFKVKKVLCSFHTPDKLKRIGQTNRGATGTQN
jgi:hypothetical protein